MPQPAGLSFVIDLRGKTPQEVVDLLASYGFEASCSDITEPYVEAYVRINPGLAKVECVWLDLPGVESLSFIFESGKPVPGRQSYHLLLYHYKNRKKKWFMGNISHMVKDGDMMK